MKTLAYDCGNPVQYVCGRMPAVLFYLLDRHALRDGVVYSIAQAWSNTYEPVLSLYVVFAGAYMMHDPPGLDAIQLVAVPAYV